MYEHVHELHIPNKFGSEKIVMEQVATLAKKIGFTDNRIEDLKTAVSEAIPSVSLYNFLRRKLQKLPERVKEYFKHPKVVYAA